MFPALNRQDDLVEVPLVDRARPISSGVRRKLASKARNLIPDRFVGNRDVTRRPQIFNVLKTQSKAIVRPDRIANDLAWETETLETGKINQIQHGAALQLQVGFCNLTDPVRGLAPQAAIFRQVGRPRTRHVR